MTGRQVLGDNFVPINYNLRFYPNMKTFVYRCEEVIDAEIKKASNRILLNAANLKVRSAFVNAGKDRLNARVSYNKTKETITLALGKKVRGRVTVEIAFDGENGQQLLGFYRSAYKNGAKTEYILTSQFEAADARAAFVCIDEPAFKSTFDVSFVIDKDLDAISNVDEKEVRIHGDGKKEVIFNTSPKMSTYLLYLGVGKFDYLEGKAKNPRIRIITVPGKKRYGRLALDLTERFLRFYEEYFKIKYPLPKLDMLAIPDFAAGAMENWGAITFREVELLCDESKVSAGRRERIADVIAHELAHQWFGDLVTMKWWDDLWLNESFATFMSAKAVDSIFPEWKTMLSYLNTIGNALTADQYRSTHPINVNVKSPVEIAQIFDNISYDKGGSVLYMFENYLGKEKFREGLRNYLNAHKYSNATKYDLWNSLQNASKVKGFSDTASEWINEPNYPVVSVGALGRYVSLAQNIFFLIPGKGGKKSSRSIPLKYMMDGKEGFMLFGKNDARIKTGGDHHIIKMNYGQTAFCRVRYSQGLLDWICAAIKEGKLGGADAWGVENDLFAFMRSGEKSVSDYLDLIEKYFMGLPLEYPLNTNIIGNLAFLEFIFHGRDVAGRIKAIEIEYCKRIIGTLGWERGKDESNIDTIVRSAAMNRLGILGHEEAVKRARMLFSSAKKDLNSVDNNMKPFAYATSEWNGGMYEFNSMVRIYKKAELPEDKRYALLSLPASKDPNVISKVLAFSLSKDVRSQDASFISRAASINPYCQDLLWKWTKSNWQQLKARFEKGTHRLPDFVENFSWVSTNKGKLEIERFFYAKENYRDDISKSLKQTLERIEANIRLVEANK
jgi:tricorn protease interacting factor F2/3